MTERRNQERGHWGKLTETAAGAGVGAPGTTGAFKTSDPLGAPGSTGASMTNQDPTAIPAAAYEDPGGGYGDYGGGQRQQLRDPTSGVYSGDQQQQYRDPTSGVYSGHQQQQHRDPTSGVYSAGQQQQQFRDPTYGDYGGGKSQQIRDPKSGVYRGGQQQQLRNPTSGVIGSGDEFESGRAGHGQVGVTGFTRITTGSTPGGGVMFGRETVTRAQDLGPAGAGGDDKGVGENRKDRVQGGPHHR